MRTIEYDDLDEAFEEREDIAVAELKDGVDEVLKRVDEQLERHGLEVVICDVKTDCVNWVIERREAIDEYAKGYLEGWSERTQRAAKNHKCLACDKDIETGETYRWFMFRKTDDSEDVLSARFHLECNWEKWSDAHP